MPPKRSLVICTSPRTGSWLLSAALRSTGRAGRPEEYLGDDGVRFYAERWKLAHVPSPREHLDRVLEAGTTGNGVFGVKVHWYQVEQVQRMFWELSAEPGAFLELLPVHLPNPVFVLLTRKDKLRQAISWYRATRTSVWWALTEPDGSVRRSWGVNEMKALSAPDLEQIHRLLHLVVEHECNWRAIFARAGVRPLELTYEQLDRDVGEGVRQVLDLLGEPAVTPAAPRLHRLADDVTDEWAHRYIAWRRTCAPGEVASYGPRTAS